MAVLSTIGIASFVSYSHSQTLQQAVNDLVVTLNTAKSNATAQVKPDSLTSNCVSGVLNGYQVVLSAATTPNSYTLDAVCGGAPDPDPASKVTTKLPIGVSFDSSMFAPSTNTMTITFGVLTGGVTGNGDIVLDGVGVTTKKTITVTPGGLIE